jgi:hypothetical protein
MSDQSITSSAEFSRSLAVERRKNALREMSFVELSALPAIAREPLSSPAGVGRLGICRRDLPDGALLLMLRCEWPEPDPFVQYTGFVKRSDDSYSERRPEIFDEHIRAQVDQSLRAAA